jgi:hypothetical protein
MTYVTYALTALAGWASQEGPAETTDFMLLGFSVILGVMALYVANLFLRFRNLRRDREILEDVMKNEGES